MSYITLDADRLETMLQELCEKLIANGKGPMLENDKLAAIKMVKTALLETYPDGVPQDLFTDPVKQKNLMIGLISAPLMEKHPDLKFDMALYFKAKLNPEETKSLFKNFLNAHNKLEPRPEKRLTEEEMDAKIDAVMERMKQEKQKAGDSYRLVDSKAASQELEEIFQSLFGITRSGERVILQVDKGNVGGYIDTYAPVSLGGGSMYADRGFEGDSTTDPYVRAMSEERLLDLGGLSGEEIQSLTKRGILHKSPGMEPPAPK